MRTLLLNKDCIITIIYYRGSNLQSHCRNFIINTFLLLYMYTQISFLYDIYSSVYSSVVFFAFELLLVCILYTSTEEYRDFLRWFYIGFTPNILPDSPQDNVFFISCWGLTITLSSINVRKSFIHFVIQLLDLYLLAEMGF